MRKHLNRTTFLSGAALVAALFCFSGDAVAQSSRELTNRMSRLENELETLSRAIYRGEQPPAGSMSGGGSSSGAAANAEVRFQQLDVQIRDLTGKVEEQNFEIRQLKETLERLSADMELRMGDLERGNVGSGINNTSSAISSSSSSASSDPAFDNPVASSNAGTTGSSSGTASEGNVLGTISESGSGTSASASSDSAAAIYENAFSMLKNGNYDGAEREFDSFLRNHGDHALAANAKYWLGETYYVRGDFERAARIFAESYQQYPKSAKAGDSLLKLGLSLASSGNTKDACVALNQLKKENPDGLGPVGRRAEQEASRLGC